MTDIRAVEIQAELRAIRTLSDGTFSVQLVLPEYMLEQVRIMMGWIKDEVRCIIEDEN
jgi:hypothetical protein